MSALFRHTSRRGYCQGVGEPAALAVRAGFIEFIASRMVNAGVRLSDTPSIPSSGSSERVMQE